MTLLGEIGQAVRDAFCAGFDGDGLDAPPNDGLFGEAIGQGRDWGALGAAAAFACRRDPTPPAGPYPGGQCPFLYDWSFTVVVPAGNCTAGGGLTGFSERTLGPYVGQSIGPVGISPPEIISLSTGDRVEVRVSQTTAGGGTETVVGMSEQICAQQRPTWLGGGASFGSISVTPADPNNTDDCGNLLPPPPPPVPRENVPGTINITNNEGDETNININFGLAWVALDGTVNVPVSVDIGEINLNGNMKVAPEFDLDLNLDTGAEPSPGPGGGPPDVSEEPEQPPEPEEPEVGDRIVAVLGAVVGLTARGPTEIFQPQGQVVLAPRAGTVRFWRDFDGDLFYSEDIAIKGSQFYVECPWGSGADGVVCVPEPGLMIRWSPVSRNLESLRETYGDIRVNDRRPPPV